MKIIKKNFNEVTLLKPKQFFDRRGFFSEIYKADELNELTKKKIKLIQYNYVKSKDLTLRGLHFQKGKYSQGKLLKVLKGKIFDVVVNINPKSKYFKQWCSFILSEKNRYLLWVPKGYAHGYMTLSKNTEVIYMCDNYYKKSSESCILWNDKDLEINWPKIKKFKISQKDKRGKSISSLFK